MNQYRSVWMFLLYWGMSISASAQVMELYQAPISTRAGLTQVGAPTKIRSAFRDLRMPAWDATGGNLYYMASEGEGATTTSLVRYRMADGAEQVIHTTNWGITYIAVDGEDVYWAELDGYGNSRILRKTPNAEPVPVFTALKANQLWRVAPHRMWISTFQDDGDQPFIQDCDTVSQTCEAVGDVNARVIGKHPTQSAVLLWRTEDNPHGLETVYWLYDLKTRQMKRMIRTNGMQFSVHPIDGSVWASEGASIRYALMKRGKVAKWIEVSRGNGWASARLSEILEMMFSPDGKTLVFEHFRGPNAGLK